MWIILLQFSCREFYSWQLLKEIRKLWLIWMLSHLSNDCPWGGYCRSGCCLLLLQWNSHCNDASNNLAFYHISWYYEYRETFRCGLTTDSRLHIAMDCGRGSWTGMTRIKISWSAYLCWPDMTPAWEWCPTRPCPVSHRSGPSHTRNSFTPLLPLSASTGSGQS